MLIHQLQAKQTHEQLLSLLQLEKFILVTMVMDTPPSHLFTAPMAVKVLFCIGDLVLASRWLEFFLQVFITNFNSFRRGKYKVVRSLISEESYEK